MYPALNSIIISIAIAATINPAIIIQGISFGFLFMPSFFITFEPTTAKVENSTFGICSKN